MLVVSWPDTKRWLFFAFASAQIITVIGITAAVIDQHNSADDNIDLAYAVSLLLTAIAMWYFVANGIFFEQKWRIIFFMVATILVFAYTLYGYLRAKTDFKDEQLVRLIIASVSLPINLVCSYLLIRDMDWLAWHIAGSSIERMDAFNWLSRFRSFLDLDIMVAITLVVMASFSHSLTHSQLAVAICGLVLSIAWIIVGTAGARMEVHALMYLFYALSTLEPIFIIYKFADFSMNWDDYSKKDTTSPIFFLGSIAIILRVAVIVLAIRVHRNFHLGLKDALLNTHVEGPNYHTI